MIKLQLKVATKAHHTRAQQEVRMRNCLGKFMISVIQSLKFKYHCQTLRLVPLSVTQPVLCF